MKTALKITLLWLPLFLLLGAFVDPEKTEYEYLPIVHFDRQPIIEGRLNGLKAYFILDSGSRLSLLNSGLADDFGFRVGREGLESRQAMGVGGSGGILTQAYSCDLALGQQAQIAVQFFTCDMDHLFANMDEYKPVGIIGGDLMKAYSFQIDFKHKQVRIRKF